MKKIIFVILSLIILLSAGCSSPDKDSVIPDEKLTHKIIYELGDLSEEFTEMPETASSGENVEIKTAVLYDADIHVYADGIEIEKTHYDSDYWGYSFIMPDKDVVVSAQPYSKYEIEFGPEPTATSESPAVPEIIWETDLDASELIKLSADDVSSVSVSLFPPAKTFTLSEEETEEFLNLLHKVELFEEDNSHPVYYGQSVVFCVFLSNGKAAKYTAFSPFFAVNDTEYRTSHQPCEDLNAFANALAKYH